MRNIGKISETVLKRSVIKPIEQNKIGSAAVGTDCAFFKADSNKFASAIGYVAYKDSNAMEHAMINACNNIYASGCDAKQVLLSISMPDTYREIKLKEIMKQACGTANKQGVKITGGHTEYVRGLENPIISVTALGEKAVDFEISDEKELDIVMTKWMGISGTAILATEKEEEIKTRLPEFFVKDCKELGQFVSIKSEAAVAGKLAGTVAMHDVAHGGIFTALWELAERLGLGLQINLMDIPVMQETIEVCEFFDINPYKLRGDGSLLIATKNGAALVEELRKNEILGTIIGHTTECIDRNVLRDDEIRYLEPGNDDELMKVIW